MGILLAAIYKDDIKSFMGVVQKTPQTVDTVFDFLEEDGVKMIHVAFYYGAIEIIKLLIKHHGGNISIKNKKGLEPLQYAIMGLRYNVVDMVLKSVNFEEEGSKRWFMELIRTTGVSVITNGLTTYLTKGQDKGVALAVCNNWVETVRILAKYGFRLDSETCYEIFSMINKLGLGKEYRRVLFGYFFENLAVSPVGEESFVSKLLIREPGLLGMAMNTAKEQGKNLLTSPGYQPPNDTILNIICKYCNGTNTTAPLELIIEEFDKNDTEEDLYDLKVNPLCSAIRSRSPGFLECVLDMTTPTNNKMYRRDILTTLPRVLATEVPLCALIPMIDVLIKHGYNFNARANEGNTMLYEMCLTGPFMNHVDPIDKYLKKALEGISMIIGIQGIDPNTEEPNGASLMLELYSASNVNDYIWNKLEQLNGNPVIDNTYYTHLEGFLNLLKKEFIARFPVLKSPNKNLVV